MIIARSFINQKSKLIRTISFPMNMNGYEHWNIDIIYAEIFEETRVEIEL